MGDNNYLLIEKIWKNSSLSYVLDLWIQNKNEVLFQLELPEIFILFFFPWWGLLSIFQQVAGQ